MLATRSCATGAAVLCWKGSDDLIGFGGVEEGATAGGRHLRQQEWPCFHGVLCQVRRQHQGNLYRDWYGIALFLSPSSLSLSSATGYDLPLLFTVYLSPLSAVYVTLFAAVDASSQAPAELPGRAQASARTQPRSAAAGPAPAAARAAAERLLLSDARQWPHCSASYPGRQIEPLCELQLRHSALS